VPNHVQNQVLADNNVLRMDKELEYILKYIFCVYVIIFSKLN